MNMSAVITAGVFVALSVAALLFLFIGKSPFSKGNFRAFYRASCGVYISGTALIFLFTLLMKGLPIAFVIISEVTIFAVFVFTVLLIYFSTKKLFATSQKAEEKVEEKNEGKEESKL